MWGRVFLEPDNRSRARTHQTGGPAVASKRGGFPPADYAALDFTRRQGVTHHGHASDKLGRLLVRLHQSENLLQPRDHITGLQEILLLSDVAPEASGDGIC